MLLAFINRNSLAHPSLKHENVEFILTFAYKTPEYTGNTFEAVLTPRPECIVDNAVEYGQWFPIENGFFGMYVTSYDREHLIALLSNHGMHLHLDNVFRIKISPSIKNGHGQVFSFTEGVKLHIVGEEPPPPMVPSVDHAQRGLPALRAHLMEAINEWMIGEEKHYAPMQNANDPLIQ